MNTIANFKNSVIALAIGLSVVSCGGRNSSAQQSGSAQAAQSATAQDGGNIGNAANAKGGTLNLSNLTGDEVSITVYKVSASFKNWAEFNGGGGEPDDDAVIAESSSASDMQGVYPCSSPVPLFVIENDDFSDKRFTQSGTFLVKVKRSSDNEFRYFCQVAFKDGSATVDWRKGFGPAHDPE